MSRRLWTRRILLCTALPAAAAVSRRAQAQESRDALRRALENVYYSWRQALARRDVTRWGAATSRYRQMCLRNRIVSMRQSWPKAVFDTVFEAPDLNGLAFQDASALGDTARLVYFGRVDFRFVPGELTPENPLVLHFLRESGAWKFNTLQYVNLGANETIRQQVRAGNRVWLDAEEFRLTGVYPDVPKPCPAPYQIAQISAEARNARVEFDVNDGTHVHVVDDTVADEIITGGLRKGPNRLVIRPWKRPGASSKASVKVNVYSRTGNPARPLVRLLSWEPPDREWRFEYELSIFVKSNTVMER